MKVFLDTNMWLRLFLKDNSGQFEQVYQLFIDIEQGKLKPYTSTIVFLEVHFVLKKVYAQSNEEIVRLFERMRTVRNMTIIEKTSFEGALTLYKKYSMKFSDCLIASQIRKGMILVSFDEELRRVKEIETKAPKEVLAMLVS